MSFVGRFVLYRSVLYQRFHCNSHYGDAYRMHTVLQTYKYFNGHVYTDCRVVIHLGYWVEHSAEAA